MAEVCAAHAHFVTHVPVQGVYTFDQPRVGDEAFAHTVHEAFGIRIIRFVNDKDIVPRVPLYGMGFRHYGSQIFFDHHQKQENGTPSIENLAGALRLAKLALNVDAVREAAKILAEAAMKARFRGNPLTILAEIVKTREDAALGVSKLLLAAGIAIHNRSRHE